MRRLAPDVALLDFACRASTASKSRGGWCAINRPAGRHADHLRLDSYLYEALKIGRQRLLLKDDPPEQLTAGIRAVVTGAALLRRRSPTVCGVLRARSAARRRRPELEELTAREREVLGSSPRG